MNDIERVAQTPADGGDISSAPAVVANSQAVRSTATDSGVVEQRAADDSPPSVGSDEKINHQLTEGFDELMIGYLGLGRRPDDDSDPHAFHRSRRLVCSASTDGQVTVHRKGEAGLALTAEEAHTLYEFLADAARIWGKALA